MKKPAFTIIGEKKCTGCSACAAVCPVDAIIIMENSDGFLVPEVNFDICTLCGVCNQVCPVVTPVQNDDDKTPSCYAGWSSDSEIVSKSSSGGIFFEMARYTVENGGLVAGVVMGGKIPIHILSDNIESIKAMRGSKYLQSQTLQLFKEVAGIDDGKNILFTGTPCQVAALKNLYKFYGINTENLITCDIICHGIPSYNIFDGYIKTYPKSLTGISFRNKRFGWKNYSIKIDFGDGSDLVTSHKKDRFMRSYLSDLGLRMSCYDCQFQQIPRAGDITLGDFWKVPEEFDNCHGTSAILANSEKGEKLIHKLSESGKIVLKKTIVKTISRGNPRLTSGKLGMPPDRDEYLKTLNLNEFEYAYRKIVKPTIKKRRIISKIKGIKKIFSSIVCETTNDFTTAPKIGLLHVPNTLNYGSMMMAENIIYYLSKLIENPYYVVISNKKEETYSRLSEATGITDIEIRDLHSKKSKIRMYFGFLNNYGRMFLNPKSVEIVKVLRDCDTILIMGGDDLSEYYGISSLLKSLRDIYALSVSGKKVCLLGQTIGPFTSWRIPLVKRILGKADSIYLRDETSYNYCKERLKLKNIILSTDLAFLDLARQGEYVDLESYGLTEGRYYCIVPSGLWFKYCDDYKLYIEGLTGIVDNLLNIARSKNYKVVLLAHVLEPKRADDRAIIKSIAQKMDDESLIIIDDILLPFEARSILGSSALVITGRMHAAVSSLQLGVPAISLAYSVKYAGVIGKSLKLPELVVKVDNNTFLKDMEKLNERILEIIQKQEEIGVKIKDSIDEVKRESHIQIEDLAERIAASIQG